MDIVSLGDSALIVRMRSDFEDAPERSLRAVLAAKQAIAAAAIPGIVECTPAYDSLGIFFDPPRVARGDNSYEWLEEQIRAALAAPVSRRVKSSTSKLHEVPVCYNPEFALDLDAVAQHTGLSVEKVVSLHAAAEYRVHCVGFMPGFPYLGGLPRELATPRRATPRVEVAAGSVAIGGVQTGIYPAKSPGGWNVIGRTPLRLFDPESEPPARLRAGDRVRFIAMTRAEFDRATA